MKKIKLIAISVIILLVTVAFIAARRAHATSDLRHVVLTPDQNKKLLEIDAQLKEIAQQAQMLKARASGIVDVYAAQSGLEGKPYKLTELPAGGYALDEVPPQAEQKEGQQPAPQPDK